MVDNLDQTKIDLPKILVTGASGFVGHYFLDRIKEHFLIYALERRIPQNSTLINHPNIIWISADVGDITTLQKAKEKIVEYGGPDFVLHLAGYYDFNYDENPEYQRTNIDGTKNILGISKELGIKRFIFASSVAACNFPEKGDRIDENTPPDASFAYARSKKAGEIMVKEYSKYFDTTVVRFAAVFSDWCEYGPLYIFINTWLSRGWKSKILGGKGKSAITYIHVSCVIELLLKVIQQSNQLPSYDIYNVSPENPVSHKELFLKATRYFYGKPKKPFFMPKSIATFGVIALDMIGRIIGKRPFEKPWMMQYVDKELHVDAAYTREKLGWRPTERYKIQRRLLYMIEHMKSYPYEWQKRNLKMAKSISLTPNVQIAQKLELVKVEVIEEFLTHILDNRNEDMFPNYHKIDKGNLRKDTNTTYEFLSVSVRSKDRVSALAYSRQLAEVRSAQGFNTKEILEALELLGDIIRKRLYKEEELVGMKQEIYDEITFTFQLMVDEVEGRFEEIRRANIPINIRFN